MKRWTRPVAALSLCLLILAGSSHAWFLATDEDEASTPQPPAAETTAATTAPTATVPPPVTTAVTTAGRTSPSAGGGRRGGKVQEASPAHKRIVEEYLLGMATTRRRQNPATSAPEPAAEHVTQLYWSPDQLPSWLPRDVRQQFELENRETQRQRAGLPVTTTETPAAVHVTRDYWENYPSWLQQEVKEAMQRDNEEFLRRVANIQPKPETTTEPPVEHVTRAYWEALPAWLHPDVKRQFELDNQLLARRLAVDRDSASTTERPAYEHVTRSYWENLPSWLPRRVRDEIQADNDKYMRQLAGIAETTTATQPSETTPPTANPASEAYAATTELNGRESTAAIARPVVAARRIESGALRRAPTQPPTQPLGTQPPPPPTRRPLTVESANLLPEKCQRQLNLSSQQKCSSSRSKWTFDRGDMRCKWFAHYGCQLNSGNLFNSLADCQNYCVRRITNPCEATRCEQRYTLYQSECFLLNDTECHNRFLDKYGSIPSLEIRMELAKHEIDLFCQPSAARCRNTGTHVGMPTFESPPTYIHEVILPPHCELPQDRGFCRGNQRGRLSRVYYYSKRQNQCKFMVNFGCSRNQNYFANLADCYNSCGL